MKTANETGEIFSSYDDIERQENEEKGTFLGETWYGIWLKSDLVLSIEIINDSLFSNNYLTTIIRVIKLNGTCTHLNVLFENNQ